MSEIMVGIEGWKTPIETSEQGNFDIEQNNRPEEKQPAQPDTDTNGEAPTNTNKNREKTFFSDLKTLNSGDKLTKKNNIQKFLTENQNDIDKFVGSHEYEQLIKDARRNYNSQNKELAIKTNFALQVYARYELGDQNISVDGMSGPQTLTVLRFIQTEGIGGEPMNVSVTPEQEQKFAEYRAYRNARLLSRSIAVASSVIGVPNEQKNNSTNATPDYSKQSSILEKNPSITESIDKLPPTNSRRLDNKNILTKDDIKEAVTANISDPSLAEAYTNYIHNGMQGEAPRGVNKDESVKIHNQAIENKKTQINTIPQRESYMACIKSFGNLLENFSTNPEQQAQWLKMLNEQASSNFDLQKLSLNVSIDGDTVSFVYDIESGTIQTNALIYKDPKTQVIHTQKNHGHKTTVVVGLPSRSSLQNDIQQNIVGRINSGMNTMADIQDATTGIKDDFNATMASHSDVISKTIASNFLQKDILGWIQRYDSSNNARKSFAPGDQNDLYRLFDIVSRTLHNTQYNAGKIVTIGEKISQIQSIARQKYTNERTPNDAWKSYLTPKNLETNLSSNNGSFGIYMLLAACTPHTSPSSDNYRIIQENQLDKLIKHHETTPQGGFGKIQHADIKSSMDRYVSQNEADTLLTQIESMA